ncbi:MAG: histidine-type phosphatase [Alistipes sp.]|nr:histidine-type phosphatase [Alistipes sp.]
MKRLFVLLLLLCGLAGAVSAQTAREEIDAHPHIAMATHSVYASPYYFEEIADAPKGYKPFYISHYGRHGSRYEASQRLVSNIVDIFRQADSLGILTPTGRKVKELVERNLVAHDGHIGELTRNGVEQHKGIARRMYHRFKGVFGKGAIVESRASTVRRCIMSMASFNESLKECQPMIETRMDTGDCYQAVIRPTSHSNPTYPKHITDATIGDGQPWFIHLTEWSAKQDMSRPLGVVFTDAKALNYKGGEFLLALNIYKRLAFMQNLGWYDRTLLDSIFTPEERYTLYLYDNYNWYNTRMSTHSEFCRHLLSHTRPLVEDIIAYADSAIEGKNSAVANLRFGHDYYLLALLGAISFNECRSDIDVRDVAKFGEEWRGYRMITMASNLQMVLYRSKKSEDVLVRFLHNENDVTLPIESETAPFYKWNDVKTYLLARLAYLEK